MARNPDGTFAKGGVGNPKGRPAGFAGLAKKVRAATNDGQELVDFAMSVFRGEKQKFDEVPSLRMRWEAAQWLADRGFGKAVTTIDLSVESDAPSFDFSTFTDEQLQQLDSQLTEAAGGSASVLSAPAHPTH